jgi:hypothetical protein
MWNACSFSSPENVQEKIHARKAKGDKKQKQKSDSILSIQGFSSG